MTTLAPSSTTIETTAQELEALSFAPIVDGIVDAIDAVAELLRGIDTAALGVPGQLALQAALALLPEDLTPATDPLIADFGALVESGPVPLVACAKRGVSIGPGWTIAMRTPL